MIRVNVLLLLALLVSSVYLVQTSYESRRLFVALERERAAAKELDIDADRLDIARRAQATSLRIERVAREQMNMRTATPAVTQYVVEPGAAAAAAVQGSAP